MIRPLLPTVICVLLSFHGLELVAEQKTPFDRTEVLRLMNSDVQADQEKAASAIAANRPAALELLPELANAKSNPLHGEFVQVLLHASNDQLFELLDSKNGGQIQIIWELNRRVKYKGRPAAKRPGTDEVLVVDSKKLNPVLRKLLEQSNDPSVRAHALHAWQAPRDEQKEPLDDSAIALLVSVLDDDRRNDVNVKSVPGVRYQAIEVLRDAGPEVDVQVFAAFSAKNALKRAAAVEVFLGGKHQVTPEIEAALIRLAEDSEAVVRQSVARALARVEGQREKAIEFLLKFLTDESAEVRESAIVALGRIAPLLNPDWNKRIAVVLTDICVREGSSDRELECRAAAQSLALVLPQVPATEAEQIVHRLIPLLENASSWGPRNVVAAIAGAGTHAKEAIPAIKKQMEAKGEPNSNAETHAVQMARFLWEIERDPASVLPIYERALESKKGSAFVYACNGLRDLGPDAKSLTPKLIKMLTDERRQYQAVRVLESIGPAAAEAIPELERLAKSKNADDADQAQDALKAIRAAQ